MAKRNRHNATSVCATCIKSTMTSTQIALYKLNGTPFDFKCTVKNTTFSTTHARFNRKNCGTYAGPGSGKQYETKTN